MEESIFEDETDPGVYSDSPSSVPLPGNLEVPAEAGSSLSPARVSPSDMHGTIVASRSSASNI